MEPTEEIFHVYGNYCNHMVKDFQNKPCTNIQQKCGFDTQLQQLHFRAEIGHIYELHCPLSKLTSFRLDYWVQIPTETEIFSSLLRSE